ncbi:MAG: hypothetical protein LBR09_02885 [Endomicrobium sp.]|jgi:hypothetical protein|nr:hypothetical protein [Endomicrobium sp.]
MTTKKQIIEEIFKICKINDNFEFDNELVKSVVEKCGSTTNPYDVTKIDDLSKLPNAVVGEDYFIAHLGNGKHKFLRGVNNIYHTFEKIDNCEIIEWQYKPSILNDFSTSESSILSLINNQGILRDFLYKDHSFNNNSIIKMYNSERKRNVSFEYYIGKDKLESRNLQIEIDLTLENKGYITIFEGKNAKLKSWVENFNLYQLYNPFRYYYELKQKNELNITKLTACYLIRRKNKGSSIVRLYNYTFENPLDMTSIKLLEKKEYCLKKKDFNDG